jgi:hemerythrin
MALIQWSKSLSVNVREIDRQHRKVVGLFNELNDSMRQSKGKDALGKNFNDLIGYLRAHFKTEERYFDQFDFSETFQHKLMHLDFIEKVSGFKNNFEKGRTKFPMKEMDFLSDWLQDHIQLADKKYGPLFNHKGLL